MEEPTYKEILEQPAKVIIYHRRLTNRAEVEKSIATPEWECVRVGPNDPRFHWICYAMYLARRMLCDDKAIERLGELGGIIAKKYKKPGAPALRKSSEGRNKKWIKDTFLPEVLREFPVLYIDEQLDRPSTHAMTMTGDTYCYEYGYQKGIVVSLNSARIEKMARVADTGDIKCFKVCVWLLAHTLVHEIGGHMLIQHLTTGKEATPPEISGDDVQVESGAREGESGNWLELSLFGGLVTLFQEEKRYNDIEQPGVPTVVVYRGVKRFVRVLKSKVVEHGCNLRK